MDQRFDAFSERCPSRSGVDDVLGRWPSLVLVSLLEHPSRFAATARTVGGISDRMLARTLTTLVADGLVSRQELGSSQHVEYELTPAGVRVAEALRGVVDAVYEVMPQIIDFRTRNQTARTA
jgi:DNA-binding HxlR family transcriptional regulator